MANWLESSHLSFFELNSVESTESVEYYFFVILKIKITKK